MGQHCIGYAWHHSSGKGPRETDRGGGRAPLTRHDPRHNRASLATVTMLGVGGDCCWAEVMIDVCMCKVLVTLGSLHATKTRCGLGGDTAEAGNMLTTGVNFAVVPWQCGFTKTTLVNCIDRLVTN